MGTVNLILAFFLLPYASDAINCLVMRPGYGLVTESCPSSTVGCRIKARSNNVEWYEWSKLYDRNQLVCIYPGEYEGTAGCVRKPSGNIRCWCGGIDDCNDPETSRQLLEAFQKSDREKIDYIAQKLEAGEKLSPATTSTTTTVQTRPTRPLAVRKIVPHKKPTVFKMLKTTRRTTTTTTTTPTVTFPSTTITTDQPIENHIEQEYPLPTEGETQFGMTFDETRKKLNEEMREEDERLQQLLADEEAEMSRDEEDDALEEQMQKERERNRMERRERARADERRRQTEEETLRNKERSQKHRKTLDSDEDDYGSFAETRSKSTTSSLSLISSTCSLLLLLLRN